MKKWNFEAYDGIDLSSAMIAQHELLDHDRAAFNVGDLEDISQLPLPILARKSYLLIAVLSLHYIENVGRLLEHLIKPGSKFCMIVANSYYDEAITDEYGIVERNKGDISLSYFARSLHDYVDALGPVKHLDIHQCGGDFDDSDNQPYWLIGGSW